MSERSALPLPPDARPRLPRGVRLVHNEAHGGWVLLAPERVFKADAIAVEIIKRCTGEATLTRDRRRSCEHLFGAARAHPGRCHGAAARARRQEAAGAVTWRLRIPQTLPKPLGLLAELTHRCPLGCPYCSNPLALDARAGRARHGDLGAGVPRGGRAGRAAGSPVRRRARRPARSRRDHGGGARGRALHQSHHVRRRHDRTKRLPSCCDAGLDHVQISIQDSEHGLGRPHRRLRRRLRAQARARRARSCG